MESYDIIVLNIIYCNDITYLMIFPYMLYLPIDQFWGCFINGTFAFRAIPRIRR